MIGGLGFGLVWGWLIGGGRFERLSSRDQAGRWLGALAAATWVGSQAGGVAVMGFVVGSSAAAVARRGWRRLVIRVASDVEGGHQDE